MTFYEITENKMQVLPLLLLADEQEEMIEKYIYRGRLFVLEKEENIIGVIVVTDEGEGVLEIKNLAVQTEAQGKGYGQELIRMVEEKFKGDFSILQVGTGDSPLTIPFYEKYGFQRTGIIKNFFLLNYDHPIIEAGSQLIDMVILQKKLL